MERKYIELKCIKNFYKDNVKYFTEGKIYKAINYESMKVHSIPSDQYTHVAFNITLEVYINHFELNK